MHLKTFVSQSKQKIKSLTFKDVCSFLLDQWFLICLGIAILIAYLVPNLGRKGGWVAAQYSVIYVCPALIFFISGLTMDTKTLIRTAALFRIHLVAQIMSYMYTSAIWFGLTTAAVAAHDSHLNMPVLGGFILLGCTPTTIGSNVVFTRSANGNHAATLIEVTIANLLAPVLSPALISMYMSSSPAWGELTPSGGGNSYSTLYRSVFKQLGLTVFVPLAVGQILHQFFAKQIKWLVDKFKINKFASVFLILIMWSTFSSCFYTGAFSSTTPRTTALVLMMNMGLYWLFLVSTLLITRGSHKLRFKNKYLDAIVGFFRFNKRDTIAICYVVPAKTPALGVPLINALYANHAGVTDQVRQMLQIPMILYQIEQLTFSSSSVPFFRRWVQDEIDAEKEEENIRLAREKGNAQGSSTTSSSEVARGSEDVVDVIGSIDSDKKIIEHDMEKQ
ncbi:SBF-like CPA transporter family-domain-containing protein [Lipomyces arxii]|uniref:SBF-like CPA transporter family-domain-containing protein n=1 Tax=Lipomyces arxii TaxID=56418 RepID=UPI0034CDB208